MICYVDTSALAAWFHPGNPHCRQVLAWREKQRSVELAYNRMLQLETGHYLRKLTDSHAGIAWDFGFGKMTKRVGVPVYHFTGRVAALPLSKLEWFKKHRCLTQRPQRAQRNFFSYSFVATLGVLPELRVKQVRMISGARPVFP